MAEKSFATSLSCMDGRVQIPMNDWIKAKYSVDFVDTITAPGIDKVMFDGNVESLKKSVMISVTNLFSLVVLFYASRPIFARRRVLTDYTRSFSLGLLSLYYYLIETRFQLFLPRPLS